MRTFGTARRIRVVRVADARHVPNTSKKSQREFQLHPVLDETALQRLRDLDPAGKNHLLDRVLRAFESSVARLGAQLVDARQKNDMQSVRHAVHTLKSSSASIGAMRLSRLCAEIEAAVRQEAFAGLPALLDDVDRELAVVLQAVQPMRSAG